MANRVILERIANEIENLITQNPAAIKRFKQKLQVFNKHFLKKNKAEKKEPDNYHPSPLKWKIGDKLSCYYATLAVIYDSVKTQSPLELSEGLADNAVALLERYAGMAEIHYGNAGLDTALKWVKKDIRELQKKDGKRRGQPKNKEAEKSIDSLKELLKNETQFSDMPKGTRKESWEWIADKIGYPKNPQNKTPRYKIMQGYLGRNCPKLYTKLTQLSQLGGESTILKNSFPHSVSFSRKIPSNPTW